jgi:LmbE family N-acetylglucosaminyl deacetylase
MRKIFFRLLLILLIPLSLYSQNSNLTILCVAAHPDDEDGATLAYYSKIKGYNAYTVFYTRGEGGQNEIGPELYDELGKIREQECYNAAQIQGSHPLFLGELDFGFSKTAKETFKMWGGKDSVLVRIVYFIRLLKPDIVISNHDTITTKPLRQHGNHQAVGITIYDAFDKAADPNYHPEQLVNGVTPWQIKKLYFRVYDTTRTKDIFTIDIHQKDASGKTIGDIAIDALSQHKTQGMDKLDWKNIPEVSRERRYELVRSDNMYPLEENDLFAGIIPADKKINEGNLKSYSTLYTYRKVNAEDSLNILKTLKYSEYASIGLVNTYDNTIENTLKAFNIKYEVLDSNKFSEEDFKNFSVIILDIRTYLYRPDVAKNNDKLIKFVEKGGNIICFYNKPSDWNGKNYSPYPIFITSERVTEEDAKVTVLEPENVLFNRYNKIVNSDWDGWVQERNIYLPSDDTSKTSNSYYRLLAMNDEDDPVPTTSVLYADPVGLGSYTYCSLALYRQLKIFNPGALKLFLNMISLRRRFIE